MFQCIVYKSNVGRAAQRRPSARIGAHATAGPVRSGCGAGSGRRTCCKYALLAKTPQTSLDSALAVAICKPSIAHWQRPIQCTPASAKAPSSQRASLCCGTTLQPMPSSPTLLGHPLSSRRCACSKSQNPLAGISRPQWQTRRRTSGYILVSGGWLQASRQKCTTRRLCLTASASYSKSWQAGKRCSA
jgi:hypothetical protein